MKWFGIRFFISMLAALFSCLAIAEIQTDRLLDHQDYWTGFYGGLNIGGVFNHADLRSNHDGLIGLTGTCAEDSRFSSFFPGLQSGYARTFNSSMVLGIEGDFTYNLNQTGNIQCTCPFTPDVSDRYTVKNRLQGSLRGRFGYLVRPQILPFITFGGSFADTGMTYTNEGSDYYATQKTQSGWLVGTGIEWKLAPVWSVRGEYYYIDYSNLHMRMTSIYGLTDPNGKADINLSGSNVKLSLNYWF